MRNGFCMHPALNTQLNDRPIDNHTIVVYPEITDHNPLNASHVVRWFLHKPGYLTGRIRYGDGELYFTYDKAVDDPELNKFPDNVLRVRWYRSDVYYKWNEGPREGTGYLLRKGRARADLSSIHNAEVLDGMTHVEMAVAFNKYRYFVTYDPYTMYTTYAAICGCIPIVVPIEGVTKSEWRSESAFGIAYGFQDIPWAIQTRSDLLNYLAEENSRNFKSVRQFVDTSHAFFGHALDSRPDIADH